MPPAGYFVDSNLLVLLVVGNVGRNLIQKHKRLQSFTVEDYDALMRLLGTVDQVFVTPNTLTETSNLLAQHREPERSRFFDMLRHVIENSREIVVTSADASSNNAFTRLGLADSALLQSVSTNTPVVTVDIDLYLAAWAQVPDSAVNFAHLRNL